MSDLAEVVKYVPYTFSALMVESLLFGVHSVLFCFCICTLARRQNPTHVIILLSIIAMFLVSLADIALSYVFAFRDVPAVLRFVLDIDSAVNRLLAKGYFYVTNNLIADGLLIYRCYKVWGSRKIILLVPGTIILAESVWGYLAVRSSPGTLLRLITFTPAFFSAVFAINIVMTLATAGRIWWVAKTAHLVLAERQIRRYHTAIAIIVESGAIYSLMVLTMLLIPVTKTYRILFVAALIRVVCIMPTLMIVQVELGRQTRPEPSQIPELPSISSHRLSTVPPLSTITASPVITNIIASPLSIDNASPVSTSKVLVVHQRTVLQNQTEGSILWSRRHSYS